MQVEQFIGGILMASIETSNLLNIASKTAVENNQESHTPKVGKVTVYKFGEDSLERIPSEDVFCKDGQCSQLIGNNMLKSFAMPSPKQIINGMAVIPIILETGKQILVGIFDLRDIWNDRSHPSEPQLKAVVLSDNFAQLCDSSEV